METRQTGRSLAPHLDSVPKRPTPTSNPLRALLPTIGLVGVLVNLAALLVTPLLRADRNPIDHGLSEYAIGPWAEIQNVGFVALGIGSLAVALALPAAGIASRWLPVGAVLLGLAGVANVGLAVFPMVEDGPPGLFGDVHQTAGTFSVAFHLAAMLALALAFRTDPRWRPLARWALPLWLVPLIGSLLTQAELSFPDLPIPFGLVMRAVVFPVLIWWTLVAVRLRAMP